MTAQVVNSLIPLIPEAEYVCQVSFVYVIVTNYVNLHRENLRSDRGQTGKTGNLKYNLSGYPGVIWSSLVANRPSVAPADRKRRR